MNSLSALLGQIAKEALERTAVSRAINDQKGVTAIEYGLIAALIAVAAVVVMGTAGTNLSGVFLAGRRQPLAHCTVMPAAAGITSG